jgi:hypothetical protein
MATSKDNPYKPGTDEWRAFEKDIMNVQRFSLGDTYEKAKEVADKRLKTATEQTRLREEKGVWVDEILEFLDGDEPEYDEVLDGPVEEDNDYWKSVNNGDPVDPLGWRQVVALHYQQYGFLKPVFKGNIVLPKYVPASVEQEAVLDKIAYLQDKEFDEETYARGFVQVPIRPTLKVKFNLSDPIDPMAWGPTYTIAEFYIRRK